jgi:hypothetical protein
MTRNAPRAASDVARRGVVSTLRHHATYRAGLAPCSCPATAVRIRANPERREGEGPTPQGRTTQRQGGALGQGR